MKSVTIYTDGACRGNGKENTIGGFGIVLMYNDIKKEIKKGFRNTTNNIMELSAVIDALTLLKEPCEVKLYSDSAYVINAVNQRWIKNWQKNGWKTASKEPVKNKELWEKLIELINIHKVEFIKVKGHSDNEFNNRCDKLANEAMDEIT
ncbi:ribonuclease HI [Clostridiaceae bacterium UIB06]|uniref:ribonuclease H n=1 Tax=Clostridium thailandense TaxID=2794346 RepID=A0A949TLC5_9CLOT|nr:ribonuclease HI [Clostridium thailandense]MBV7274989.1 ribonuclease HI [Clostridium thailandense]MCH5137908.1 ribonuclease HI [Clostridiaceae bacterium UIB06]